MTEKLHFTSDYMEGAHPALMDALMKTNALSTQGYGDDAFTHNASSKILKACGIEEGKVYFLAGGTQTNAVVIDSVLKGYEGVIAADSGHVGVHEAGAIEFTGHKVLTIQGNQGKISAEQIRNYMRDYYADANYEHMVKPGMVYISQPTEYGSLYSLKELEEIHVVCNEYEIALYVDGARLAYALSCPKNDVTLKDLGRLCDVFYIGGTKCGALFGEAVVLPHPEIVPHFFSSIKQHGALLAKGRVLGVQFDALFTDGLYERIGEPAITAAMRIKEALLAKGYAMPIDSPTNQIFFVIDNETMKKLGEKVEYGFMEKVDDTHCMIRFATAWSTGTEKTEALLKVIEEVL